MNKFREEISLNMNSNEECMTRTTEQIQEI